MTIRGNLRTGVASGLAALLVVLSTGLPTHHHGDEHPDRSDSAPRVVSVDHHAHTVALVDQADRVPRGVPQLAAIPSIGRETLPPVTMERPPRPRNLLPATGRSPPPVAPRAPPYLI